MTYTGEKIKVLAVAKVHVRDRLTSQVHLLPLRIVCGSGPTLLGRDWISTLDVDWTKGKLHHMESSDIDSLLNKYSTLFSESSDTIKGVQAHIHVKPDAKPKYFKARPLLYILKKKVDDEINRLLTQKIIEPVETSEWAAPIVPVPKPDSAVRLCGDYKVTVNPASDVDRYPIPRIADLYASLGGGKWFCRLDLKHAYEQIQLHPESRKYVTINTHRGLFTYTVLPYGVSSAPSIFQRVIDTVLQGIPRTLVYLDDCLIAGDTQKETLTTLKVVFSRLEYVGFRLKKRKVRLPEV